MFAGFTIGSLNSLPSILSVALEFLQLSKEQITSGITPLNPTQISSFRPYTYFASIGYCHPSATSDWSCGPSFSFLWGIGRVINYFMRTAHCVANRDFIQIASGGDGGSVQFCKCYIPVVSTINVLLFFLLWRACWVLAIASNCHRLPSRNRYF